MAPGKRAAELIDLTGEDGDAPYSSYTHSSSQRPMKHARTGYSTTCTASRSSRTDPLLVNDEEDEEDGSQEVPDATQGASRAQSRAVLYGAMAEDIVGCQYYSGIATVGEMVVIRREPHNQYDRNAIQVLNVNGVQIGHLNRKLAAKLAPYMDSGSVWLEGIITGYKSYQCPISIQIYGTNEPTQREALVARMKRDHLPVTQATERRQQEQQAERQRQQRASQAAQAARKEAAKAAKRKTGAMVLTSQGNYYYGDFQGGVAQGMNLGPSLDDIVGGSERINPRNVEQVVEEFGTKEEDLAAMPKASQPKALNTELHPFQLQGLQWMLEKESPTLPAAGSSDVVQLWQRSANVPNAFTNVATKYSTNTPVLASGGILADDMGLGKTIQVISLLMADKELGRRAKDTADATLILAPVSVMSNWSTQIKKHIKEEHALRVMFYHGTRKQPISSKEIEKYDVVITTYDSISTEWHSQKSTTLPRKSGVFSVKWRRVILDEGHNIRNPKAKKTIAASSLMAQSRWVLTGTPIINNLKDLYSLVRFLRLSGGLEKLELFHTAIIRPVNQGSGQGNQSLQSLMRGICLRRKKEMTFIDLRLPELSEYVHKITLFPHEQEKYAALEAQAKGTLDVYRNKIGKQNTQDTYRHLLEVLLRMRQLCNHWKLVGDERLESVMKQLEAEGVVDLTEENKVALQKMLQLSIDSQEDCPVCLDMLKEPVITKCAHIFCSHCIEQVIDNQQKCPMCRAPLDSLASTTVKPAKETSAAVPLTQDQIKNEESLKSETSSKVEAILQILQASAQDPTNKTIIFSQWTSFLDVLSPHLAAKGFKFTRIDGSMTAPQRDLALEALDSDPATTVMLASLSVCSVGLNLVAANKVIMADSWWAPAIEDQAVDRVHRLGQKRETTVFRIVIEGSVEERVLSIQAEKRHLMSLAFAEKDSRQKKRGAGAGLADLERLLGGRGSDSTGGRVSAPRG